MKTMMKAFLSAGVLVAMTAGTSAMAVTRAKTIGYHCVNSKGFEVHGAAKASECRLPYHWIKAGPTTASAKAKARGLATVKRHKGRVATSEKKTLNQ